MVIIWLSYNWSNISCIVSEETMSCTCLSREICMEHGSFKPQAMIQKNHWKITNNIIFLMKHDCLKIVGCGSCFYCTKRMSCLRSMRDRCLSALKKIQSRQQIHSTIYSVIFNSELVFSLREHDIVCAWANQLINIISIGILTHADPTDYIFNVLKEMVHIYTYSEEEDCCECCPKKEHCDYNDPEYGEIIEIPIQDIKAHVYYVN